MYKKCLTIVLTVIVVFWIVSCVQNHSNFTIEEHVEKINELVGKNASLSKRYNYDSYDVYPLYDYNDEVQIYLVEFHPKGYIYVKSNNENVFIKWINGISMYTYAEGETSWQRYTINQAGIAWARSQESLQTWPNEFKEFEIIDGQYVYYENSCYKIAALEHEKKLLLSGDNHFFIPAVLLQNGDMINLISMHVIDENINHERIHPDIDISFYFKSNNL